MNEKGSILPSISVFVLLLIVMLLSSVKIYNDQVHQLVVTKEAYKARTMIQLTEKELLLRLENKENIETATVVFDVGKVMVKKTALDAYRLNAITDTQFSIQKEMSYTLTESEIEESSQWESSESKINSDESFSE